MKKILFLLSAVVFGFALIFSACEGPEGPPGADGTDGKDANATCLQCHDESTDLVATQTQWAASGHATGSTFERNTEDCASCHTAEGFAAKLESGSWDNGTMSDPSPHTCRSCHLIHESYTTDDYELVFADPFAPIMDATAEIDLGAGNLCAQCHQGRDPGDMTGDTFEITSAYWGVHHGPQGNIAAGMGAYDFGTPYSSNNVHSSITDACVTCHMADPYGNQAGGHTFNMTYMYHGHAAVLDAGCVACHDHDTDPANDKVEALKAEIQPKIDELASLLLGIGILADDLGHAVPGTWPTDQAGALLNYLMILEDRSVGTHNPAYVEAVLDASIAAMAK